ncbi:Uncharacterised protein [Serratia liquefaciens]|nr:Uncharacterised protein [Serratia liquefaciens]
MRLIIALFFFINTKSFTKRRIVHWTFIKVLQDTMKISRTNFFFTIHIFEISVSKKCYFCMILVDLEVRSR